VEVTGEVDHPGIHLFRAPPTLKEVIEKAGELEGAVFVDKESSQILETGTRLTIGKGTREGFPGDTGQDLRIKIGRMEARKLLVFSIPLDLNRVSAEDLCLLPGIGKALAHEIVSYRKRRRGFRSVLELKEVKGISKKRWKELMPFFKCDDPEPHPPDADAPGSPPGSD